MLAQALYGILLSVFSWNEFALVSCDIAYEICIYKMIYNLSGSVFMTIPNVIKEVRPVVY